jgi:hypothetical protein
LEKGKLPRLNCLKQIERKKSLDGKIPTVDRKVYKPLQNDVVALIK